MLSIPADLHHDPKRPSIEAEGVTIVDYVAGAATAGRRVVVTQPTIVFVHEGLKELSSGPGTATLAAPAGSAVVMRTGAHIMADLLPTSSRYRSTVVSIECGVLLPMLGTDGADPDQSPAVVVKVQDEIVRLASGLRHRLARCRDDAERSLAVKELLVATLLDRSLRDIIAADLAGWGPTAHERIRSVVDRHCTSPLALTDYASMCSMSLSTFKRRFQEVYGSAPGRWLIATRLNHAAGLLTTVRLPVTDICRASGFGDLSNFTRSFTNRFGMPPSAYRAAHARRDDAV